MCCPTLTELPPPPKGKTGWPWTEESEQLPNVMADGSPWPRISIVTPSYNQGEFIEETIRSILLQGYPDLEYIIIDGGSTDESVEIIEKYSPWLKYWVSEPDRGQAHAINKGFEHTSGSIGAYINSDDYYNRDVFGYIASRYIRVGWGLLIGQKMNRKIPRWRWIRRSYWKTILHPFPVPFLPGSKKYSISQESTMWCLESFGHVRFDEELQFCLDVDWYVRIISGTNVFLTSKEIGFFRDHPNSKTNTIRHACDLEYKKIIYKYAKDENSKEVVGHFLIEARKSALAQVLKVFLGWPAEYIYTSPGHKN